MQFTSGSTGSLALILSALAVRSALAYDFTCDETKTPNYGDCQVIVDNYNATNQAYDAQFPVGPSCRYLNPPFGVDPNSLNCVVAICPYDGVTSIYDDLIGTSFGDLKAVCETDPPQPAGGEYRTRDGFAIQAYNNPAYYVTKRSTSPPARLSRKRDALEKRENACANGKGQLTVFSKTVGAQPPEYLQYITRIEPGSTYLVQKTDTKMVGVQVSVSVEAGFFKLFSATAGVTVSESMSVASTTGIMISNPCGTGQDAAIYLAPTYTQYECVCETDHTNIDVNVPDNIQNSYTVRCLG